MNLLRAETQKAAVSHIGVCDWPTILYLLYTKITSAYKETKANA